MNQTRNHPECAICNFLPTVPTDTVLIPNHYWSVNLGSQDQTWLGRSYITLKRHVSELDELTDAEEQLFITVRNQLIRAIREAFNPITFNIACLKNDAFKMDPDNTSSDAAHVHWHVIPRYGTLPVELAGEQFTDPYPGRYILEHQRKPMSSDIASQIADAIRSKL